MDERLDSSGRRLSGGKSIDTEELTGPSIRSRVSTPRKEALRPGPTRFLRT